MTENLHEDLNDSIVREFFDKNDDVALDIEVTWQIDLGFRVLLRSGDVTMCRAGHATSLTLAVSRLIERAVPKIAEYRADQAKYEAALETALAEDDDED